MLKNFKIILITLVLSTTIVGSEVMYVQSQKGKLLKAASPKADVVINVNKGEKVKILEKKGMFYKVESGGKTGWMVKYVLSATDPNAQQVAVSAPSINLKKNARKRASAYSTAATARGLDDDKATEDVKQDIKAIKKMEENSINKEEVEEFIHKGKLKGDGWYQKVKKYILEGFNKTS